MKVLFVDQSGKLGGAELSLVDVASAFDSDSSVVLFEDGPFRSRLESAGIRVQVLQNRSMESRKDAGLLKGLKTVMTALPLIRELAALAKGYDVIYANTQKAFVFGALAGFMARRPVVYHLRDILSLDHFSAINIKVAIFFGNYLTRLVIANSQATARSFIQSGGKANLVKVIYNGFDPDAYQSSPADRDRLRTELKLDDKFVIGQFSRLSPWKGQHILLEALAKCPDSVVAVFVGAALFGEDEYAHQIKQQVADLGLTDRVHFLGFRSDIPHLMGACDVVAHTSTAPEPFGRVIIEGMLCGRPVIAADAGGAKELVTNHVTGWTVEPGDSQQMAAAIIECFEQTDLRESIARNAYTHACENFHVDRLKKEIITTLRIL